MSHGIRKLITDMDEHAKLKGEIRDLIKDALEEMGTKQDREVSAIIKRQCDERYGPTWECIVGEDFKAAFTHETKHFMFVASGKQNVVQPYSGSPANMAVYTALLKPHDRIMGLDLPSGGHLTHGYYTYNKAEKTRKAVSATSIYFESLPYTCRESDGLLDYDELARLAAIFKPALIICGGSAYPREWDYARFRAIADDNGSLLLCDMAHISGLVAAGVVGNPFEFADVVTTTTHKSLAGPRSGMIFFRKDARGFEDKINFAVFPSLQGGPHEHQIAGVATQLRVVASPVWAAYASQVIANSRAMAAALVAKGYKLATGGTDNHLVLWDLRPTGVNGTRLDKVCDECAITLNKNTLVGDRNAFNPGGVRIGAPALTSRGFKEADFVRVADFLHQALLITTAVAAEGPKDEKIAQFTERLHARPDIAALKAQVQTFARAFPMPGRVEEGSL